MGSHLQWSLEARTHMRTSVESYGTNILKTRILRKIINAKSCKPQEKRHREDIKATRTRTNPGKTEGQRVISGKENATRKTGLRKTLRDCLVARMCVWPECFGSTMAESKEVRGASLICRAEGVLRNAKRDEDVRSALPGTSAEHVVISERKYGVVQRMRLSWDFASSAVRARREGASRRAQVRLQGPTSVRTQVRFEIHGVPGRATEGDRAFVPFRTAPMFRICLFQFGGCSDLSLAFHHVFPGDALLTDPVFRRVCLRPVVNVD